MPSLRQQDYWILQSTKDIEYSFDSQYEIGKELGRSLTSSVFKCQKRGLSNTWSVKILDKNVDKKVKIADVGILLKLDDRNLIRLKEIFESKQRIFLVQELVTGGELFDRIVNVGDFSEATASRAINDILDGLTYLHENGIVHRNIKPDNLLYENLSPDSPLKLADFGLSTIMSPEIDMITVCGTPMYTAPEVLKGERNNKSVDMWAVGVILYILMCGYEPFIDEDPVKLFKNIIKGNYEFSQMGWGYISENAKDLTRKLLQVCPKKRITAEAARRNLWVNGVSVRRYPLEATIDKIKKFNERRKEKITLLKLAQTTRSRPNSRLVLEPAHPASYPQTPIPNIEITQAQNSPYFDLIELLQEEEHIFNNNLPTGELYSTHYDDASFLNRYVSSLVQS